MLNLFINRPPFVCREIYCKFLFPRLFYDKMEKIFIIIAKKQGVSWTSMEKHVW